MTNKKIIIYFAVLFVIGTTMLLAFASQRKPFDDSPANHLEELKQIPEVAAFYEKYGQHDVLVSPDGAFTYQVKFQAENEQEQRIQLRVNYRFGSPSSFTVFCTPDEIGSQYRVTDNVLEYLKERNCFST